MRHFLILTSFTLLVTSITTSCGLTGKSSKSDPQEIAEPMMRNMMDSVSYLLGTEIGASFKSNLIEINPDLLLMGVQDAMQELDTILSEEDKDAVMTAFQFRLQMAEMERREKVSAENRQEQETFMAANRKDPTVIETESGIQYRVIVMGQGEKPQETDTVQVHYEGRFVDGEVFDASRNHTAEPIEFPLNRVIPGWTEVLQLMPAGSTFEVYLPADLAYGERGNDRIPPAKMLVFTIEYFGLAKH
jgi:FKBP-type peptidyl-prolyl cis-trans isomerase FklB